MSVSKTLPRNLISVALLADKTRTSPDSNTNLPASKFAVSFPEIGNNFKISVYNRTLIKAKKFSKKFKCVYQSSIKSLCKNKDIIILCLTTDSVVESIIDQIIKYINPGSIIIDHSTINYQVSNRIYNIAKKRKVNFLDAPITGGPIGAEQGKLGIMVGGDNSTFKKTENTFKPL